MTKFKIHGSRGTFPTYIMEGKKEEVLKEAWEIFLPHEKVVVEKELQPDSDDWAVIAQCTMAKAEKFMEQKGE